MPPIVPILIHHSDTGWTAATAFQDIVAGEGPVRPALEPHIPHFELRLIDLSEGRASLLVERALTALGQLVLWCLSVAGNDASEVTAITAIAGVEPILTAPAKGGGAAAVCGNWNFGDIGLPQ